MLLSSHQISIFIFTKFKSYIKLLENIRLTLIDIGEG